MTQNKYKNLKGSASSKQKDILKKFGLTFSSNISKQEASNLITKRVDELKSGEVLASAYDMYLYNKFPELDPFYGLDIQDF